MWRLSLEQIHSKARATAVPPARVRAQYGKPSILTAYPTAVVSVAAARRDRAAARGLGTVWELAPIVLMSPSASFGETPMSARLTLSRLAALAACATGRIAHAADTTSPSAPSTDAQIAES